MANKIERRFIHELRADTSADGPVIVGYAAKFNSPSADLGGFKETIMPGAFTRSISSGADVRALMNHDPNMILGRTKNKTLSLEQDGTGLKFRCVLPNTQAARDLHTLVQRGDIDSCSFAFTARDQSWENERSENGDLYANRKLMDVDLMDISAVTYPAYGDTEVQARMMFEPDALVEVRSAVAKLVEDRAKTDLGHGSFNMASKADSAADHLNAARKHAKAAQDAHAVGQHSQANDHTLASAAHYEAASKFTPETPEGDAELTKKAQEMSSRCGGSMRSQEELDAEQRDKDEKGHGSDKKGAEIGRALEKAPAAKTDGEHKAAIRAHGEMARQHGKVADRHIEAANALREKSDEVTERNPAKAGMLAAAADAHDLAASAHTGAMNEHYMAAGAHAQEGPYRDELGAKASEAANAASKKAAAFRAKAIESEMRGSESQPPKLDQVDLPQPFDPKAKEDWWNAFADAYDDLVKKGGRGYGVREAIGKAIAAANLVVQPATETPDEVTGGAGKDPTAIKGDIVNTTNQDDARSKDSGEKRDKDSGGHGSYKRDETGEAEYASTAKEHEDAVAAHKDAEKFHEGKRDEAYIRAAKGGVTEARYARASAQLHDTAREMHHDAADRHGLAAASRHTDGDTRLSRGARISSIGANADSDIANSFDNMVSKKGFDRSAKIDAEKRSAPCECGCAPCKEGRCKDCSAEPRCANQGPPNANNMDMRSGEDLTAEDVSDPDSSEYDPNDALYDASLDYSSPDYEGDDAEERKSKAKDAGVAAGEVDVEVPDDGADSGEDRDGAKTKTVSGKILHSGDFAWVGDAGDPSTWKLPVHDEGHAKNALARFNQTQGIPADKKEGVWKKIVGACKKFGIQVSEQNSLRAAMPHSLALDAIRESDEAGILEALKARTRLLQIELE